MVLKPIILVLAIVGIAFGQEEGEGERRLKKLRERQVNENGIISFNTDDFKEFALSYPRPYELVIYFTGMSCKLCDQLKSEYEYTATLYAKQGLTKAENNPVFFAKIIYNRENQEIFQMFSFTSIPNLVVSKPEMALIAELQKKQYLQKFKWAISYSDGDVTTHKMLDFVNQRTSYQVDYKPPLKTMLLMFFGFIGFMAFGVIVYTKLRHIWTNWLVWLIGVLCIYFTCVSGVVYDIIHDVPFVGRNRETGEAEIFTGGTREQYGAEGVVISSTIVLIGLLFISIPVVTKRFSASKARIWGLIAICTILFLVFSLENIYKSKSWYGPSFFPPEDYSSGPISRDQGNNI